MPTATRVSLSWSILLVLGTILASSIARAAEPCPWANTEHAAVCQRWNALSQQLDKAEARAQAAEQALQALKANIKSMGQALQPAPQAANANEQRVRQLLDSTLNWLQQRIQKTPAHLVVDRNYTLQPKGDAYLATFKQAALVIHSTRIDLSPLQVTVEPQADGDARIGIQLPDSIPLLQHDKPAATLTIGSQQLALLWSEKLQASKHTNVDLKNLKLAVTGEPGGASLSELTSDQQLTVGTDDQWQNQQHLKLTNFELTAEGKRFQLGSLIGSAQTTGSQYSRLRQLSHQLQQLGKGKGKVKPEVKSVLDKLADLLKLLKGYHFSLQLADVKAQQGSQDLAKINNLTVGSSLGSGAQGTTLGVNFGLTGVQTPMSPLPPALTPDQANLDAIVNNIPHKLIDRLLEIGMNSEKQPVSLREAYAKGQLLKLLETSGLELRIKNTYVAAPEARADLKLRANVDAQAAFGAVGEMMLKLTGMDKAIAAFGGNKKQSPGAMLSALMAFSNRTEQNGKTIDEFDLNVTKDGKLMLNHKDVTALFMPGQSQSQ